MRIFNKKTKCVLHAGMPKCGSSSLQTFLSTQRTFKNVTGRTYIYAAIKDGHILFDDKLDFARINSHHGYISSSNANDLCLLEAQTITNLKNKIFRIIDSNSTLILSNESWGHYSKKLSTSKIFQKLGLDCHIILYVRPQVEWFNSAWWQWGAWSGFSLPQWINRSINSANWATVLSNLEKTPGVSQVSVRILPEDVVDDFLAFLNIPRDVDHSSHAKIRSNPSMPAAVLRLFQRNRELRNGPHDSSIEFVLGRHLNLDRQKAPWIIGQPLAERIIRHCAENNTTLLGRLEADQAKIMKDNPAWWTAEHYLHRQVQTWKPNPPSLQELESLTTEALLALWKLDTDYRQLQTRIARQKKELSPKLPIT